MRQKRQLSDVPEDFLVRLLDEIPAAVFCKDADADFRFVFWNSHAEKIWGLSRADAVGKSDFELFPESQAQFFREKDEETMRQRQTVIIPEEELHAPGGNYWLRTRKVPIELENPRRRFLLGISEDITRERQLDIDLGAERAKIASMQRMGAVGELAGSVAHEVNSPLSALLIQLELFRIQIASEEKPPEKEELRSFVDNIQRIATKIMEVTKALYTYATYSKKSYPELVNPAMIVKDSITLNREKFRLADIELRLDLPAHNPEIRVRPMELLQALLNLIDNAVEAMPESGPRWIEISLASDGEKDVRISVSDSGQGVPPEATDSIMEPYQATKKKHSAGLGLAVARSIVESYAGQLTLDENSPHTRFLISIPVAKGRSAS